MNIQIQCSKEPVIPKNTVWVGSSLTETRCDHTLVKTHTPNRCRTEQDVHEGRTWKHQLLSTNVSKFHQIHSWKQSEFRLVREELEINASSVAFLNPL